MSNSVYQYSAKVWEERIVLWKAVADDYPVMQQHRHTVKTTLKVSDHPILSRALNDSTLRVMVFCAGDTQSRQDISFPHQSEIKVNSGEVKANLRGLKNKPGSTRPVDITKDLRLNLPHYTNSVEMTYALTSKVDGNVPHVCCFNPQSTYICFPSTSSPVCRQYLLID